MSELCSLQDFFFFLIYIREDRLEKMKSKVDNVIRISFEMPNFFVCCS